MHGSGGERDPVSEKSRVIETFVRSFVAASEFDRQPRDSYVSLISLDLDG